MLACLIILVIISIISLRMLITINDNLVTMNHNTKMHIRSILDAVQRLEEKK